MLLRSILGGGVWNGFLMGKMRRDDVKCRCCGDEDGDGHLFRGCFFSPDCSCSWATGYFAASGMRSTDVASVSALAWTASWA